MLFRGESGIEIRYGSAVPHRAHCGQGAGASAHFVKNDEELVKPRYKNRMPVCNRGAAFPATPPIRSPMLRRCQRFQRAYKHAGQCREPRLATAGVIRDSQRSLGKVSWRALRLRRFVVRGDLPNLPTVGTYPAPRVQAHQFHADRQSSNIRRNHSACLRFFRT